MKYELKIALPMYKIIYSMLFMVIIILVRPIMSYNEIVSVLESSVRFLQACSWLIFIIWSI